MVRECVRLCPCVRTARKVRLSLARLKTWCSALHFKSFTKLTSGAHRHFHTFVQKGQPNKFVRVQVLLGAFHSVHSTRLQLDKQISGASHATNDLHCQGQSHWVGTRRLRGAISAGCISACCCCCCSVPWTQYLLTPSSPFTCGSRLMRCSPLAAAEFGKLIAVRGLVEVAEAGPPHAGVRGWRAATQDVVLAVEEVRAVCTRDMRVSNHGIAVVCTSLGGCVLLAARQQPFQLALPSCSAGHVVTLCLCS